MNIIEEISQTAPQLNVADIDGLADEVIKHYVDKINFLSYKTYGELKVGQSVAHASFKERAKIEVKNALECFLFKFRHWEDGRDLNSYLLTCLNRLSTKIYLETPPVRYVNSPICPGCKFIGSEKEYLITSEKMFRCEACLKDIDILAAEIKKLSQDIEQNRAYIFNLGCRLKLRQAFAIHSKSGVRCKDCNRFIPKSLVNEYGVSCPYSDCDFFGNIKNLEKMAHPLALKFRGDYSLDQTIKSNSRKSVNYGEQTLYSFIKNEDISADSIIEFNDNYRLELETLRNVIDDQMSLIERNSTPLTIMNKRKMYEAYKNLLNFNTDEMISYLVHRKQSSDDPIQTRIFQEYARLMADSLPYDIKINNRTHTVCSLTDPIAQLFSGISEFTTAVRENGIIYNETKEHYTGGVKFKDYGPCFIGMLIDVLDENNQSLMGKIKNFTFVQINSEIDAGTKVTVKHFRIPSHYEIMSLVFLQRCRRKIVDSVHLRLTGKKRKAG